MNPFKAIWRYTATALAVVLLIGFAVQSLRLRVATARVSTLESQASTLRGSLADAQEANQTHIAAIAQLKADNDAFAKQAAEAKARAEAAVAASHKDAAAADKRVAEANKKLEDVIHANEQTAAAGSQPIPDDVYRWLCSYITCGAHANSADSDSGH